MTIRQAVSRADKARPNMIDEEIKVGWVYELEAEFAEMMQQELPENKWKEGGEDVGLLVPFPYDKVYELYVCAMIDNHNQESAAYANDLVVANAAIDAAKAWWNRKNMPKQAKQNYWKVM